MPRVHDHPSEATPKAASHRNIEKQIFPRSLRIPLIFIHQNVTVKHIPIGSYSTVFLALPLFSTHNDGFTTDIWRLPAKGVLRFGQTGMSFSFADFTKWQSIHSFLNSI